MRKGLTATLMAAMLVTAVTPADAGPRRWGGWRGHGGWHHRGHTSLGDVIVGGLIIGVIASALSGAAKRERQAREGDYEVLEPGDDAARHEEDRAVDACATALESGGAAKVDEISDVGRFSNGWRVEGVVAATSDGERTLDSFSCTVRDGQVADIRYGSQYRAER